MRSLFGVLAFAWPGVTLAVLVLFWGAFALELVAAVRLRKVIQNEWWLALSGIASMLFGVVLLAAPGAGAT